MVFQNYALYPHMTVEQNLGFGLKLRKTPKVEIKRRVDDVARILGLDPLLKRKPAALSGGQRQRVAMGRAMVREPRAFLMDEPLSNLDAKLRVQMRAELARLRDRLKTTTVYVTHDQVEAMTLGDRVAVMRDGVLQQCDTPQNLFKFPVNLFVAAFIGSPAMNLVEARVAGGKVEFAGLLAARAAARRPRRLRGPQRDPRHPPVRLRRCGARPRPRPPDDLRRSVRGRGARLGGARAVRRGRAAGLSERARAAADRTRRATRCCSCTTTTMRTARPFTARVSAATTGRPGNTVRLTVDPAAFHFFDPSSGASLADRVEAGVA